MKDRLIRTVCTTIVRAYINRVGEAIRVFSLSKGNESKIVKMRKINRGVFFRRTAGNKKYAA